MFCDIRGFTELFDQRDPIEAVQFANAVLGELGNVVEACGGTVDKFTGDGFLAHFGILTPAKNSALDACWCAIRMRDQLMTVNTSRYISDQPVVSIGIGIHHGTVATGVISTFTKSEFTVLGDVVNMAARIESLTKEFTVDCLVSEAVVNEIGSELMFQKMPFRPLKGIRSAQLTYWLLPTNLFSYRES